MNPSLTPILRWAGSKRKLLPKLAPYWSGMAGKYIEPFAGSAALFFEIGPADAVLADINSELISTYSTIVQSPRQVYDAARRWLPIKARYLALRSMDPAKLGKIERAARFLYLNRYCFNGLYRTDNAGRFNVPFAPHGAGTFPAWDTFAAAAAQLARARLVRADFATVLRQYARTGDFVYLDPPYAVANRRIFRQYGPQTFGLTDLERLADCLYALDSIGARFVVSYAQCSEANAVFKGWSVRRVYAQRNISGFARHRRMAAEILVTNL